MISTLVSISQGVMVIALLLTLVALFRGPTGVDRLLAGEKLALGLAGLLLLQAAATEDRLYVDAALGLALFSFVGAVVFGIVIDRGEVRD